MIPVFKRFRAAVLAYLAMGVPLAAVAHLGPPFPVMTDQPIPGYGVTVLTNPDVNQAVVIVVLEPVRPGPTPAVAGVDVWIQPRHGGPKSSYRASPQSAGGHLQFQAAPDFDALGMWRLGVDIRLVGGRTQRFVTDVEATPPGIGPWGLLLFSFPFLLFGGLWVYAFVRRRKPAGARGMTAHREFPADPTSPSMPGGEGR